MLAVCITTIKDSSAIGTLADDSCLGTKGCGQMTKIPHDCLTVLLPARLHCDTAVLPAESGCHILEKRVHQLLSASLPLFSVVCIIAEVQIFQNSSSSLLHTHPSLWAFCLPKLLEWLSGILLPLFLK